MRISLAEFNNIVCKLENSGFHKEAEELHQVFIKVAELEKEAGIKKIGKAAIPALTLFGNSGNVASDYKSVEKPAITIQQNENVEDPIEKDQEVGHSEERNNSIISDRLKKFLEAFELKEIQLILAKQGISKKIEFESDLEDPEILDMLEKYYKELNLEKLNPVFDPIAQQITSLLMHNKSNEQRLVKLVNQYWNLSNRSTRFDSAFIKELNLKLKQVAQTDKTQLRKFLIVLRNNFQTNSQKEKSSILERDK